MSVAIERLRSLTDLVAGEVPLLPSMGIGARPAMDTMPSTSQRYISALNRR